jgi:hypothetical protein
MLNIGRSYSTLSSSAIVPEKIYMNADLDKLKHLKKDNKGKSGVYVESIYSIEKVILEVV